MPRRWQWSDLVSQWLELEPSDLHGQLEGLRRAVEGLLWAVVGMSGLSLLWTAVHLRALVSIEHPNDLALSVIWLLATSVLLAMQGILVGVWLAWRDAVRRVRASFVDQRRDPRPLAWIAATCWLLVAVRCAVALVLVFGPLEDDTQVLVVGVGRDLVVISASVLALRIVRVVSRVLAVDAGR